MSDYPTANQFYETADLHARYVEAFGDEWESRANVIAGEIPTRNELVSIAKTADEAACKVFADRQSMYAYEWLKDQPTFVLAEKAVGFVPCTAGEAVEQAIREAEIQADIVSASEWFERKRADWPDAEQQWKQGYIRDEVARSCKRRLEKRLVRRLKYISGVARCSGNYLSGHSAQVALELPGAITKMQSLVSELQQLISDTDGCWGDRQKIMERHIQRVSIHLDEANTPPVSRRRDVNLPARLMASELIQLHYDMSWRPSNRAIFQLMGLPFVEGQMEMRTIERLAKPHKERRKAEREYYEYYSRKTAERFRARQLVPASSQATETV